MTTEAARGVVLFRSADLLVRMIDGDGDVTFVTFDPYGLDPDLDRPGFGEAYFAARGIPAVHVLSAGNRWYQYPELDDALAAIRAAVAGRGRVIAYGSSMGGYAALTYGAAAGAQVGIAISPQYSIDRAVVPFETRWADEAALTRFRRDDPPPLPDQVILYDPWERDDARHHALYAARSPTRGVRVFHGGHPVGGVVNDNGLLAQILTEVAGDRFDAAATERALRAGRRRSGQYLFSLSLRTSWRRIAQKETLARMAVAASPDVPYYLSHLANVIDKAGRFAEARPLHDAAMAASGAAMNVHHNLMWHHEMAGDLATARALVERLIGAHPDIAMLRESRDRIRRKARRRRAIGWLASELGLDAWLNRRDDRRG